MKIKDQRIILRQIFILDRVTPIILTLQSMESKPVAEEEGVVQERL